MINWKELRRNPVKELGGSALWSLERLIARTSLVGTAPFFDPAQFAWARPLEREWQAVRRELDGVLAELDQVPNFQDISTDQASLTTDDRWKTFFLYGMGYKAEANCARCPETTRLIEAVPGMRTAFFSILAPGKHIPPHRGLWKGFLRYHLGLKVPPPAGACRLRVADEVRSWEEGQSLIFDDTFDHEAWNDTDGTRVVLFLDVDRPLRFPMNVLNRAIIRTVQSSGYVQAARRNQEAWSERLAQQAAAPA